MSIRSVCYQGAAPKNVVGYPVPVVITFSAATGVAPQNGVIGTFNASGFYETLPDGSRKVTVTTGVTAATTVFAAQVATFAGTYSVTSNPGVVDSLWLNIVGEVSVQATLNDSAKLVPVTVTLDSDGAYRINGPALAAGAGGLKGFTITYIAKPYTGPPPTP